MKTLHFNDYYDYQPNKKAHTNTNVLTKVELNLLAEELMKTPVDYKTVLGYKSESKDKSVNYCKYNKDNEVLVIYTYKNNNPVIIHASQKTIRDYNSNKSIYYLDEIEQGK